MTVLLPSSVHNPLPFQSHLTPAPSHNNTVSRWKASWLQLLAFTYLPLCTPPYTLFLSYVLWGVSIFIAINIKIHDYLSIWQLSHSRWQRPWLLMLHSFLKFNTTCILTQIILCYEGCLVCCRIFSGIHGLYLLDSSSTHPPKLWQPKMFPDSTKCLEMKTIPVFFFFGAYSNTL